MDKPSLSLADYIILILSLLSSTLKAGAIDYKVQRISADEGVVSNQVNVIMRTADGFLWIGSASGLARYDGYGYLGFQADNRESSSLLSNHVTEIYEGRQRHLWIRTDLGPSLYDMDSETFTNDIWPYLSHYAVKEYPLKIYTSTQGSEWFFAETGIYALMSGDETAREVTIPDHTYDARQIIRVCESQRYIILVGDKGGIQIIDKVQLSLRVLAAERQVSMPGNNILDAYLDHDALLWVWSLDGLRLYDMRSLTEIDATSVNSMLPSYIRCIVQDNKGQVWIACDHHGIIILNKNLGAGGFSLSTNQVKGFTRQTVSCMYEDGKGTVWIGTSKYGLYRCDVADSRFDLLPIYDANAIAQGPGATVWIGTDGEWLYSWDYKTGATRHIGTCPGIKDDTPITCLCPDTDGGVYIGTYEGGLIHYGKRGEYRRYGLEDGLLSKKIWALQIDNGGRLWVGTLGTGLQYYDKAAERFVGVGPHESNDGRNYITSISEEYDGKLYISTGYGVREFDTGQMTFRSLDRDMFSSVYINQVMLDDNGVLWVATRNGLNYYFPQSGRVGEIDFGIRSDAIHVHGIARGPNGSIWASSGSMLTCITPLDLANDNYNVTVYRQEDGLPGCDYNQRSVTSIGGRLVLAGSLNGVTYFQPGEFEFTTVPPSVIFTALTINGQKIMPGQHINGRIAIESTLSTSPTINIPAGDMNFTIYFATDNYSQANRMTYLHRFAQGSGEWIESAPGTNYVSYDNLSPGEYTLLVKAINAGGIESAEPAVITIQVHPPFWLTKWAIMLYTLMAVILIIVIYIGVRHRIRRDYNERRHLAEIEKQEQLNSMKLRFFTNISHEMRTPLTLILSPVESMLKDNPSAESTKKLHIIQRNAQSLLTLINQILDMRKLEMHGLTLDLARDDIMAFLRMVGDNFSATASKEGITYLIDINDESTYLDFDHDKLGKITTNLLSNAFKFTPQGGEIIYRAEITDVALKISVADTGIGISDADKPHIFERFYQSNNTDINNTGSGIGLNLVWEYIQLMGGTIQVRDNVERGTVFDVSIPLPERATESGSGRNEGTGVQDIEDNRPKLLVVDDNRDIIEVLTDTLSKYYRIMTAYNGKEAWIKVVEQRPDVIVSDVMMPEMDGYELCRRVKSDPTTAQTPFVFLTAKEDISSVLEGLNIGADEYISKPFNAEELHLRIDKLLRLIENGLKPKLIAPSIQDISITPMDEKLVHKALQYVEANLSQANLTVEELSTHLGMSRVNLYKKLTQITGQTPIEFIRKIRLRHSMQLLRESQMNISEIAFAVGFGSSRNFSKYFKEEYGMLPSEYQRTYSRQP